MLSVPQLIRNVVRNKPVQQYIVEKDYALSYLLLAIAETKGLAENVVLKGGTALKKLYFTDYRFSEDLDYSTRVIGAIQNMDSLMDNVVQKMNEELNQRGPFQINFEPLILNHPHPGEQRAFTFHVQFPGQRQPLCRLKVEITIDEPILSPIVNRSVIHGFQEKFDALIPAYSLTEITAEKLRTLLQSKEKLHSRGWGASRVCRDYYDLWNLLQLPEIDSNKLLPLLEKKCLVRNVTYESAYDFISDDLFEVARSEWQQQLQPFVPHVLSAAEILPQVKSLILSVWE